jgi:hypothetical protein
LGTGILRLQYHAPTYMIRFCYGGPTIVALYSCSGRYGIAEMSPVIAHYTTGFTGISFKDPLFACNRSSPGLIDIAYDLQYLIQIAFLLQFVHLTIAYYSFFINYYGGSFSKSLVSQYSIRASNLARKISYYKERTYFAFLPKGLGRWLAINTNGKYLGS